VHAIDVIVVCAAAVVVVLCALVLARQRFMLHASGSTPMAVRAARASGARWLYGVARYAGGELQWYRALGLGTRASKVWQRADLIVVSRRSPQDNELGSLPSAAVIVTEPMPPPVAVSQPMSLVYWTALVTVDG